MDETSVEFSVLLTVNSTWTKLNYWNAYKTQTSGAPEHVGTREFVLAMFGHIHFFPYSNEIRESHKGRETGWPASISRCRPASVPYLLELPYLIVGGRLSQAHRLVSTALDTPGYVQGASDAPASCLFQLLFVTRVNVCWLSTCRRWFCHPVQEKKISSTVYIINIY